MVGQILESATLVAKHEHETTVVNEETKEILSELHREIKHYSYFLLKKTIIPLTENAKTMKCMTCSFFLNHESRKLLHWLLFYIWETSTSVLIKGMILQL